MEQLTYRFSLDTHKNGVQRTLQGFETGDGISRKLVINLVEEDRPFMLPLDNVVAAIYVKRPSQSSPSINTCSIDGDQIVYELTDSDLEEAGIVTCQLKLIFGTIEHPLNVIVSPRFDIEVWESMASDSVAEDTQEYTALEAALAKAQMCYEGRIISFSIDDSTGVLTVVYGYDEETQTHVTYTSDYFKDNLTPTIEVGTVTEGDVMSVTNSGTALHAIFDFILKKGEKGDDGFSAVANVVKSGDTATITITDKTGTTTAEISDGADGQDGQDGQDGYSPSASVTKFGDTATITITDKNGTTTAEISDGADGQDGQDGADGYSPTATVVKSGSTATITITDKNGTTTAQVSDGTGTTTSWNQIQQSGDKIAEITINGTKTDVYNKPISTATQTALDSKTNNTMVANVETTTTATQRYEIGDNFIYNGVLYEATAIIANGATITVGTNCKVSDNITKLIQNSVKKAKTRKYIFVGDSYSAGTYGATGWIDLVNSILGLTPGVDSFDARNISQFYGGSFSDGAFKIQLTDVLTIIDAPEEITDIYVFAGQNEYTYTDSVCLDKIADFISYANTNFPNAKVHLGFIGRGNDPQYFDAMNAKCRCYIQGAMENGADYVNNIEYVNRMYSDYNADKIHPNSYTEIANYIALGIVNGSVDVQRKKAYSVSATSNASGAVTINITQSNELIMVEIAVVLSSFTADIVSGGALAGTKLADVDFDIIKQNFEIPFMANVRNAQNQFSNEYLILVRSGSDLKIKCNKLIASGWQNIPAPADASNMNITRDSYSAMVM